MGKGNRATKPSARRYKAMQEDVRKRVLYAFWTKNHANPYPVDDKRHARFTRELFSTLRMDDDFEDICQATGTDTSGWVRRAHPNPGPVKPIEQLV